jgi:hypothetical protein
VISNLQPNDISGSFMVFAPGTIIKHYPHSLDLTICKGDLCGLYDFGSTKGELRLSHMPTMTNKFLSFEWRSQGDDTMAPQSGTGEIAFVRRGRLVGMLPMKHCGGIDIEFAGMLKAGEIEMKD